MPEFVVLYRRADHADANSVPFEAGDINQAAKHAIESCSDDEYACAVWQKDTPPSLIAWHTATHSE